MALSNKAAEGPACGAAESASGSAAAGAVAAKASFNPEIEGSVASAAANAPISEDGFVTLYTAQAQVVLDAIERDGASYVKMAYVNQKYGSEAWIFKEAYAFFAHNAPRFVPKPPEAETGIWAYVDEKWAGAQPGSWVLKLRVPADQALLFDLRVWNRILNLNYVPKDDADDDRFEKRLQQMGVSMPSQAFSTPFYPQVKQEIRASWQRLFTSAQGCPATYLQAGLWKIDAAWVQDARQV